ncbi:MAG: hypothetical protein ACW97Z_17535, partial [Candidatus Hodarchaeales archaeon]
MEKFINDEIPSRWSTFRINLYATLSRLSENKEEKKVKIMKKKLSIGLFISLLIPILSSALTVNEGNAKISDSTSIAIIFSTGGLGDKAFNDAAYQGLVQANTTYSGQFNYTYVLPDNEDEVESYQQSLAS